MQFANPTILKEAEHFLVRTNIFGEVRTSKICSQDHLEAGGGTNTHDALRSALQEPDVETISFTSPSISNMNNTLSRC